MSGSSFSLKTSLVKKYWMALTGLFLCSFLVVHLIGNLQLFPFMGGQEAFNTYAKFMTTNPLIKISSYLLYFSILFHAFDGFLLAIQNRKARPVKYARSKASQNSSWASRNMALLGTIVLVFIVTHMQNFWYKMKFGTVAEDQWGNKDLWSVVYEYFQDPQLGWLFTLLYVIAMGAVGYHLLHGFQSAFQTMGLNHPRYTPIIKKSGAAFAILVPALFAVIPIYIFLA